MSGAQTRVSCTSANKVRRAGRAPGGEGAEPGRLVRGRRRRGGGGSQSAGLASWRKASAASVVASWRRGVVASWHRGVMASGEGGKGAWGENLPRPRRSIRRGSVIRSSVRTQYLEFDWSSHDACSPYIFSGSREGPWRLACRFGNGADKNWESDDDARRIGHWASRLTDRRPSTKRHRRMRVSAGSGNGFGGER